MTQDFKKSDTSPSSGQYGISWVLGGIAVGLMAGALVYYLASQGTIQIQDNSVLASTQNAATSNANPAQQTANTASLSQQDKAPAEDNRPGFSYHAVLPQLELDVPFPAQVDNPDPDPEPAPATAAATPAATPAPAPAVAATTDESVTRKGSYLFQLGSYKTPAQAQQMQKIASKNGMNTRVEKVEIQGQTWYRVRLGPTDDLQIVNRWKQMLSGMGISPMVIRL